MTELFNRQKQSTVSQIEIPKLDEDKVAMGRRTYLEYPPNSDVAPEITKLLSILQNDVESFTVQGAFTDKEGKEWITSVDTPVELTAVNHVDIKGRDRIKEMIGTRKHVLLVIGTKHSTERSNPITERIAGSIQNYLRIKDNNIMNSHVSNRVASGEYPVVHPLHIFDKKEFEAAEKLRNLAETGKLKKEKPSSEENESAGHIQRGSYEYFRIKKASGERYHSLFILEPNNENGRAIIIWVANKGLDKLLEGTPKHILAEFKPLAPANTRPRIGLDLDIDYSAKPTYREQIQRG